MKTVAAFNKPFEAHMLVARLESSGIAAFTRDEHMVTLDWLASNAIGGVKVDVADEDYEKAIAVMSAPSQEGEETCARQREGASSTPGAGSRVVLFLIGALPMGVLFYIITPAPKWERRQPLFEEDTIDSRPLASAFAGTLGGMLLLVVTKPKWPNKAPDPTPTSVTSPANESKTK
jgi:hypothetical protein